MSDLISRQAAIDALWKALYEYEDKTEKQFIDSEELNVADWIQHRIFVQNMSDIDRQTILGLPTEEPERKWIPVTEALPKDDTDVLVQFSNNMAVGYYKYSRWGIATGADLYCRIEDYEEKPIAWMPLPEVYGGKNE